MNTPVPLVYNNTWFTPATQYQHTNSGLGMFDTLFKFKTNGHGFNVVWPPLLTGLIIVMLVVVVLGSVVAGCWVGDIVFPKMHPYIFTLETLAMSLGSALIVFIFRFTRTDPRARPSWLDTLKEYGLLAVKFGIMHLIFQFTGFYSWAFPDSALGGSLNNGWDGAGADSIEAEKANGIDTGAFPYHDHKVIAPIVYK